MNMNNRGFTLVEMIVVTAMFVVVIMITGDAFKTILTQTSKLYKSEESNIEGVIGLEMLRHDLEQAGYGLPHSYDASVPIEYTEAGYDPAKSYNDAPSGIPRAVVAGNDYGGASDPNTYSGVSYGVLPGSDYLALKGSSLRLSDASQKWTYITYSSNGSKPPKVWSGNNFKSNDKVIMLRRSFSDSGYSNQLIYAKTPNPQKIYWVDYNSSGFTTNYSPTQPEEIFYVYGIQGSSSTSSSLGMPFNRADFFVARPSDATKIPSTCAPRTGILYKAIINHSDSKLSYVPLLDCIADMQVVLGWNLADENGSIITDSNSVGSGQVDTWSNADGSAVNSSVGATTTNVQAAMGDAGHVRTKLKLVKIYLLAQNGKKDTNYTSPASIQIGDDSERTLTKPATNGNYNLTTAMLNYRWKVYRLVVKPKNLVSNQ